ncbi:MAG: hypothetical protein ABI273_08180 [Lacunisphaera sp.]
MSSKQMDEALAGKKTITYIVVSKDEVIDLDGRHFAPAKAKAYLKKAKPEKKAAFIFLMADESLLATVRSMIDVFGNYGATIFAVRKMPKGGITVEASSVGTGSTAGQRTLQLVGLPNPSAISAKNAPPAMAGRPENLRPGKLPPRVRYKFVADEMVVAAAAMTEKLFLSPETPDCAAHFETVTLIQPGAWKHLSDVPELIGAKPLVAKVELGSKVHKMEGRMLTESGQFMKAVGRIRELLAADGGGKVRALYSEEMNHWWTFIGFDIEEPVFAIESKGGKYVFIVSWLRNRVFSLDELKALPTP